MDKEHFDKTVVLETVEALEDKKTSSATLLVERFDEEKTEARIESAEFTIGRENKAGNDLVLNEEIVSARHATIIHSNGLYYLKDLNSSNGTRINGKQIEPGKPHLLKNGVVVEIGNSKISFHLTRKKGREPIDREVFEEGAIIYKEGDPCSNVFIILEGKVEIFKLQDNKFIFLDVLEKGDFFGEAMVISKPARADNVRAMERTETLVLTKEDIGSVFNRSPETIVNIVESLSTKILDLKANLKPNLTNDLSMGICLLLSLVFRSKNLEKDGNKEKGWLPQKEAVEIISEILFIPGYVVELIIEGLIFLQLIKTEGQHANERYLILSDPNTFIKKCTELIKEVGVSIFNVNYLPQKFKKMDILDLCREQKISAGQILQNVANGQIPVENVYLKKTEAFEWLKKQGVKMKKKAPGAKQKLTIGTVDSPTKVRNANEILAELYKQK